MAKTVSRVRAARREANRVVPVRPEGLSVTTTDSYQNFAASVGLGTANQASYGNYGFNPITRLRIVLDWAYRGSWLVRACVDAIPEDMTREGISFTTGIEQDDKGKLATFLKDKLHAWTAICDTMKWGRLYGGAGIYMVIDGQKSSTPLDINTVTKGSLLRLVVLDRWMVNPSLNAIVTDPKDPDAGMPEYYDVVADAPLAARQRIHHSRFIRFEGLNVPYYQRLSENMWTISILEPLYDRITAFDSTSNGAAQLAYKAHLRTYSVEKLRQIIAAGGKAYESLLAQLAMMRQFQTNEGITLIDASDKFETHQYTFAGISDLILQFAQQVSGAEQIPLVRLFGQSPAGLNATGESDWRNYYDGIKRRQEESLADPLGRIVKVAARSEGIKLSDDFAFEFNPLYQLDHVQRASVAQEVTGTVQAAFEGQLITKGMALQELKASSDYTGIWTNITDEDIEEAEKEPPMPMPGDPSMMMGGDPNDPNAAMNPMLKPPDPASLLHAHARGGSTQRLEEQGEDSGAYLPGLEPPDGSSGGRGGNDLEDMFLPRRRSFLPGGDPNDGPTPMRGRPGWRTRPTVSFHINDADLPGRDTNFAGLPVTVEVEKGAPRFEGSSGGATMRAPYGYFSNTVGHDGDAVDVFLGENTASQGVYILHQCDPDSRAFVQHKCFIGFDDPKVVVDVFVNFYADDKGRRRLLRGQYMPMPEFRVWLEKYRTDNRVSA